MNKACPRCGAEKSEGTYGDWLCGSYELSDGMQFISSLCLRNQLAAANSEIERLDLLVRNCASLLRRFCYQAHKRNMNDKLKLQAEEFLKRHRLQGSPLKGGVEILDTEAAKGESDG